MHITQHEVQKLYICTYEFHEIANKRKELKVDRLATCFMHIIHLYGYTYRNLFICFFKLVDTSYFIAATAASATITNGTVTLL